MPVKHGMLSLLELGPSHGYQLKHDFEVATGGAWQLNIGQVYTTLQRLERDGLVTETTTGDDEDDDRREYEITPAGRAALDGWYATPIVSSPPPRDELAIKVLMAVAVPGIDTDVVIQRQRTASVEQLQQLTRRKRDADPTRDLPLLLHLDALIMKTEADVRWLDACESRLRQHVAPSPPSGADPHRTTSTRPSGDDHLRTRPASTTPRGR